MTAAQKQLIENADSVQDRISQVQKEGEWHDPCVTGTMNSGVKMI